MPLPEPVFETGYDRVVRLDFPERIHETESICVGRRIGRVRVEAGADRAWEFDPAGRLVVAQENSLSLHATFDGRVWGHRVLGSGADRRLIPDRGPDEPITWLSTIHRRIRRWREIDVTGTWIRGTGGDAAEFAADALALAAARSPGVVRTEVEAARNIWRQVPVLPPDQYEALVLQISEGCPWDRCRFCSLYQDVPYREKTLAEVERHLDEVLRFVGASASRIRRVFLGQANALLRDTDELLELMALIRRRIPFPEPGLDSREQRVWLANNTPSASGFFAFVDAFHRPRTVEDWGRLRQAGLRRVYLGLESGDARRLAELGKPLDPERAVEQVHDMHTAGLPVGVILMTGIARPDQEAAHRTESARVVSRMLLRPGDQVYLSPLVHPTGAELTSFDRGDAELVQSGPALERMREALRGSAGRGVPIATYDLGRLARRTPRG